MSCGQTDESFIDRLETQYIAEHITLIDTLYTPMAQHLDSKFQDAKLMKCHITFCSGCANILILCSKKKDNIGGEK